MNKKPSKIAIDAAKKYLSSVEFAMEASEKKEIDELADTIDEGIKKALEEYAKSVLKKAMDKAFGTLMVRTLTHFYGKTEDEWRKICLDTGVINELGELKIKDEAKIS